MIIIKNFIEMSLISKALNRNNLFKVYITGWLLNTSILFRSTPVCKSREKYDEYDIRDAININIEMLACAYFAAFWPVNVFRKLVTLDLWSKDLIERYSKK